MNDQNSVLNIIGKVSGFLSKYIAVVILITSAVAFTHPQEFMWIPQYTEIGRASCRERVYKLV